MKEYVYYANELLKSKPQSLDGINDVKSINVKGKVLNVSAYDICYGEAYVLIRFFNKKKYIKKDMIGHITLWRRNNDKIIIKDGDIIADRDIEKPY